MKGYLIVGYIDDILLIAETPDKLSLVVTDTIALLRTLGFTIHDAKSITVPSQIAKILGFILNSRNMTLSMVPEKADCIKAKCHNLLQLQGPAQIGEVASVVGLMISSFTGVNYGPLCYRPLENIKTDALQANGWDLEGKVMFSPPCKQDLLWWIANVDQFPNCIAPRTQHLTLLSDSSLKGWGAVIEGTSSTASAVATTRSALSTFIKVDGVKVGDHPFVSRIMTGLFNLKPALPRYTETWDPQIVLNHLRTFPVINDMSLKQLTLKLVVLMALLSAQRVETLKSLSLEGMTVLPGKYNFHISSVLKQTTSKGCQNRHLLPITFHSYTVDKRLCVVDLLTAYLKRTSPLRKETKQLLICHAEPHGPASKDTIS